MYSTFVPLKRRDHAATGHRDEPVEDDHCFTQSDPIVLYAPKKRISVARVSKIQCSPWSLQSLLSCSDSPSPITRYRVTPLRKVIKSCNQQQPGQVTDAVVSMSESAGEH